MHSFCVVQVLVKEEEGNMWGCLSEVVRNYLWVEAQGSRRKVGGNTTGPREANLGRRPHILKRKGIRRGANRFVRDLEVGREKEGKQREGGGIAELCVEKVYKTVWKITNTMGNAHLVSRAISDDTALERRADTILYTKVSQGGCWKGYHRNYKKKRYTEGSCVKNGGKKKKKSKK